MPAPGAEFRSVQNECRSSHNLNVDRKWANAFTIGVGHYACSLEPNSFSALNQNLRFAHMGSRKDAREQPEKSQTAHRLQHKDIE
jgi:hypothetical protein